MLRITAYRTGEWRSVSAEDFESRFLEICQSHRAQGRALAFAFILFDRAHPYVRNALAQQHYWEALDERSGRSLSVFSIDVRGGAEGSERRWMNTVQSPSLDRVRQVLSDHFEGAEAITTPCVLFFQVADGKLVDSAVVQIAANGLTDTYEELESVIGTAADAVNQVQDVNAGNANEIFNLIVSALRERQRMKGFVKIYHLSQPVVQIGAAVQAVYWLFHLAGH